MLVGRICVAKSVLRLTKPWLSTFLFNMVNVNIIVMTYNIERKLAIEWTVIGNSYPLPPLFSVFFFFSHSERSVFLNYLTYTYVGVDKDYITFFDVWKNKVSFSLYTEVKTLLNIRV